MNTDVTPLESRSSSSLRRLGPLSRSTRLALAMLLLMSHPLWAVTIIVDEATCTLVDAITAANTDTPVGGCVAGSGADMIELTTNVSLSVANNTTNNYSFNGLPVIATDITIKGNDFVIERSPSAAAFRLFHVLPSGTLTLNDLTLRNGRVTWHESFGGAIESHGTVVLTNSTLSDNFAEMSGGAIHHHGPGALVLVNSTVSGNFSGCPGHVDIGAQGTGGGITISGGVASLTNSTVSGNTASSYRGCCDNVFDCTGSCDPWGRGGGVAVGSGSLSVTNSTISGNLANLLGGGASIRSGSLSVTNSTISDNLASRGGGFEVRDYNANVSLANTIVAGNSVFEAPWSGDVNCDGGGCAAVVDFGNNFSDNDIFGPGVAEIIPGVDFDTTLADNGGPTLTHALLPGSVAIDAAGDCGLETDQRGFLRWDGACDSGAFEYGATAPDADQDGVLDEVDMCLDTAIPESVPTRKLGVNRWTLVDDDGTFDTAPPPGGGGGPDFTFTIADTGGCSCEQIIEAWDLGQGHTKFGCSTGVMLQWITQVGTVAQGAPEVVPELTGRGNIGTISEGVGHSSSSSGDAPADSREERPRINLQRNSPKR